MLQYFDINKIFKVYFIWYKKLFQINVCINPENTEILTQLGTKIDIMAAITRKTPGLVIGNLNRYTRGIDESSKCFSNTNI